MGELIDLQQHLAELPVTADPLAVALPHLHRLLHADRIVALGLKPAPHRARLQVDFLHTAGLPSEAPKALRDILNAGYARSSRAQVTFDALHPEPRQRNVLLGLNDVFRVTGLRALPAVSAQLMRTTDARPEEQSRTLICDRQILLAFVAFFRPEPFSPLERRQLTGLFGAVRERLLLARQLTPRDLLAASLAAALEAVGAPVFITGPTGSVLHANAAGLQRLEREFRDTGELLANAVRGRLPDGASCTPISAPGMEGHHLVILRDRERQLDEQAARAALRWRLTPRQSEILGLLARGLANKSIAQILGCTAHTVELHVSAILERAGVESRSALVALVAAQ